MILHTLPSSAFQMTIVLQNKIFQQNEKIFKYIQQIRLRVFIWHCEKKLFEENIIFNQYRKYYRNIVVIKFQILQYTTNL